MCRISGIINPAKSINELHDSVQKMCTIMQSGGPDGEGFYISEELRLVFGHRRLSLLDLSEAGKQPMTYDNGKFVITYNGEIYNYPELKKELEGMGFHFKTLCDTEVILVAFSAWGTEAFKRFAGMFAFALYDKTNCKLYLVRDPSGIKPLYYYHKHRELYFSSEVKALQLFRQINQPDERAKVLFLAYGHLPEPYTTLKEVKMLPKGSCLIFEILSGKTHLTIFQQYQFSETGSQKEAVKERIRENMHISVKRHLLADAPIGVFLSGGIDSSLLTLLAHEYSGSRLKTLSLYFNENKFSEKKYQDLIIDQTNCLNAQFLLTKEIFDKNFENILSDMDGPTTDGINTWFISKYARESGLKAVLSGVGSDELFGGYPSFRRMSKMKYLQKVPLQLLNLIRKVPVKKLKRLAFLNIPGIAGEYLFLRGLFVPLEIASILNLPEHIVLDTLSNYPVFPDHKFLSPGNQASWMELNLYMQNQLLRDADVMSMAHGIEIRVPFLDPVVIETAFEIKSDLKYAGSLPKQILIDSFKNILPEAIWNRPKMGFTFPFKDWIRDSEYVKNMMNKNAGYQRIWENFLLGKLHWSQLMAIIVLENKINAS